MTFTQALVTLPPGYTTPSFPSLYWPLPVRGPQAHYLYHPSDIWRFTTVWTVIFYGASHLAVCFWAIVMGRRHWKVIWGLPIVYVVVAGFEALIAGGIVGGLIGAVYQSGYYRMSTWIPFVWAFINTLVLILSSFAIQGGL